MSDDDKKAKKKQRNLNYKNKKIKDLGGLDKYREAVAATRKANYHKQKAKRLEDPLRQAAAAIVDETARQQVNEYIDAARKLEKAAEAAPRVAQLGPIADRVSLARSAATLTFATGGSPKHNCERNVDILIEWEKSLVDAGIVVPTAKSPVHSRSYLKTIFSTLKKIYKRIFGEPWHCDTFGWLKDWDRLYEELGISYKRLSTRTTNIGKVTGLVRWLAFQGPEWAPTLAAMRSTQSEESGKVQAVRAMNQASPDEAENSLPWEQMVALLPGVTDIYDKFLYGYQVLFAPRRLDVRLMRFVVMKTATVANLKTDPSLDAAFNYFVKVDARKGFFVFKNYKTVNKYGTQVFAVPAALLPLVNAFIKSFKVIAGSLLFPKNASGGAYSSSEFSSLMVQLYRRVTGKEHMLQNYVRHSFSTWLSREFQNKSVEARMEYVKRMGHSLSESELYKRVEQDDEAKDDDEVVDEDNASSKDEEGEEDEEEVKAPEKKKRGRPRLSVVEQGPPKKRARK